MRAHTPVTTWRTFKRDHTARERLREVARAGAVWGLSKGPRRRWDEGVQILYYHHIFDDERAGFERQLAWLSQRVDWVSYDEALRLMREGGEPGKRYLAVTFDDGFENCFTHAMPILEGHDVPATFFLATDFIGANPARDPSHSWSFFTRTLDVPFMTWDQCRQAADAGFTFGSHTCTHASLIDLNDGDVHWELERSKAVMERELGRPCDHFCAPRGKPMEHFDPSRAPALARQLGYRSFATTEPGVNVVSADPFMVRRRHAIAAWGNYQLKYFLGL
ncbi:MAG: polysaccharide deacetylase family protein [Myxococcota bacterium]|nr:polysaccharide deacetylase family protein [Myxococcota bacterium]